MKPKDPVNPIYDAGAAPVNGVAARVMRGGAHWKPAIKQPPRYFRDEEGAPIPRRPSPGDRDLTGQRFGSFLVKGLAPKKRVKNQPAAWLVRCDCGAYEARRFKVLTSAPPERLCCSHCDYQREMLAGRKPPLAATADSSQPGDSQPTRPGAPGAVSPQPSGSGRMRGGEG